MKPLLCLLACLLAAPATAGLMLHPTRIVFDKNQRAAQVDLINDGDESASYRISLVERRMSDSGEFIVATAPLAGEQPAQDMLRFSPRQVTLAPHSAQTVRLMLRKPAELAEGEYRSHLHVERLPEPAGAGNAEAGAEPAQGIGITLNVLVGATIPVIVRHGATNAAVTINQLALEKDGRLSFQLERSGNASVYGDLLVSFVAQRGAEVALAHAGGVAVYTPNTVRRASLALAVPKALQLAHGTLLVRYRERLDAGGKLLAEAALALP